MSYDYLPLIGLSSATDMNGYVSTYQYDDFNRLLSVKDAQGNILKDLFYHYANESPPTTLGITPTNSLNYIISRTAREAQTTTTLSNSVDNTTTQVQYMDGLGRPLQSLVWQASPDKTKDLISSTNVYDAFGRVHKSILPTPSNVATGDYRSTAESLASGFYGGDTYPFSQTFFEPSPLNRPKQLFGAGQAWRVLGTEKFVKNEYQIAGDGVIKFDLQTNGTVNCGSNYGSSTLYSQVVTSERGFLTYEVKDNEGRVTHKIQQLDEAGTLATTAYCYDVRGNLAVVIPPEAYRKLGAGLITSFTEADEIFKELMYGYHFDTQNRQNEKHLPGAGWRYSVFDKHDREVAFADDADKAKGYWQFRKFDALSREIQSGLLNGKGSKTRTELQTAFDGHSGLTYETTGTTLLGYTNISFPTGYVPLEADVMSVSYFDDYAWQTETAYNFNATTAFHAQGLAKGMMTGQLKRNVKTNTWQKMVMYYDYKGRVIQDWHLTNKGNLIRKESQYRFNNELIQARLVKFNGSGTTYISTKTFKYEYDHLGRKTKFNHFLNGADKVISRYNYDEIGRLNSKDFNPKSTINTSQSGSWNATTTWSGNSIPTLSDYININAGHTVTINSGEAGSAGSLFLGGILNNYGTLHTGSLPPNSGAGTLQTLNFKYHIRGGLKGINLDASGNLTNNLFSYRLDYEEGTTGLYDGNIKKQHWKSNIDGKQRSFEFTYDGSSRLKSGTYTSTQAGENYSLNNVTYDFNGNITALSRSGATNNTFTNFGNVDNLNYTYQSNSNKLSKIQDVTIGNADLGDFRDGTNTDDDYEYWLDGSLKKDKNKKIASITYNYLKLPEVITFDDNKTITTEYDAQGTKLKKIVLGGETTDYEEDEIYINNVLYQTSHDEGRINAGGEYEYNINDHLGNLRVSFRDSLGVAVPVQSIFYDPWGLSMKGMQISRNPTSINKHQFLGAETQVETGYIDLQNRQYDPQRGQFTSPDALAELSRRWSPFSYSYNNPIRFSDPDGLYPGEGDTYTTKDNNGNDVYNDVNSQKVVGYGGKSEADDDDKDKGKKTATLTADDRSQSGIGVGSVGGKSASQARDEQIKEKGKPDGDGQLTYAEAGEWSHYGNGVSLTIEAGKIDFSNVYYNEVPFEGKGLPLRVNLKGGNFSNLNDAVVYGNVLLVKDSKGRVKVLHDEYNFETGAPAHPWYGKNSSFWRNVITLLGAVANGGSGTKYTINFSGFANVSPGSRPLPSGPKARPESEIKHRNQ
jgi:RHS repeat-associated protein